MLNEQLHLTPADLLDIFEGHNIARRKLKSELQLFMQGERERLPPLVAKINCELLAGNEDVRFGLNV